jgi:hypothetical protein
MGAFFCFQFCDAIQMHFELFENGNWFKCFVGDPEHSLFLMNTRLPLGTIFLYFADPDNNAILCLII